MAGFADFDAVLKSFLKLGHVSDSEDTGKIGGDRVARRLADCGVAAIDVAGAGGTSWSEVEAHRQIDPLRKHAAFCTGSENLEMLRQARLRRTDTWEAVDLAVLS